MLYYLFKNVKIHLGLPSGYSCQVASLVWLLKGLVNCICALMLCGKTKKTAEPGNIWFSITATFSFLAVRISDPPQLEVEDK